MNQNQQNRVSLILAIAALLFLGLCNIPISKYSTQTTTSFNIGTQAKLHLPQQPGESGA